MDSIRGIDAIADRLHELEHEGSAIELTEIGAMLEGRVAEATAPVEDSVPLSALAARADENLQLARLALSGGNEVRHARFHLRRAVEYMRQLDEQILVRTRDADRVKNQRDFVNG